MSELDLDITHYDVSDLESFFNLDGKSTYTVSEIDSKVNQIKELLFSTGHIAKHLKRDLIVFLQQGREILIDSKVVKPKPHSSLPSNNQTSSDVPPAQYPVYHIPQITRKDELIEPNQTSFTYTQNSEFFPGTLNPIDTRTLKKCISIDTRFRTNPYSTSSSDFTVTLPNRISKVISLECTSFEIAPGSIPNISESLGNNYLYVGISTAGLEYSQTFILVDGYYTLPQLIHAFNVLFIQKENTPYVFIEFIMDPEDTGKILLTTTSDYNENVEKINDIKLNFRVNITGNIDNRTDYFAKMGRMLGFTRRLYENSTQFLSETVPNPFLDLSYFYLSIDDFQNRASHSFEPAFSQISMPTSILARIAFQHLETLSVHSKVEPISIVTVPRKYFGPIDMNRLHIRLLDVFGRTINMNHHDYSFCLTVNTIYDL
tara:strand:+ start:4239 stop:5528 length:1290 start_codon:yes stop_codon:yes gene_type:complete